MQNATLHFCESSLFNSTNCPGAFEQGPPGGRNRCYTTSQVDVPQIALNYSQTNNGGQGMSCTDPVNKSAGQKVKVIRGLLLITLIACLMSAASAQSTLGSCKSSQDAFRAAAAPCDGQDSNLGPAPRCGIDFYSDKYCTNKINSNELNINPNLPYGCGACLNEAPTGLPQGTVYVKTNDHFYASDKLFVIGSGECVDWGPNDVLAEITQTANCIQVQALTEGAQYQCFPNGCTCKGTNGRLALSGRTLKKKRDATCKSFQPEGDGRPTYSRFTKVSDEVSCKQSASPCTISIAEGKTATFSSEFSLTGGGTVKGIDVGATFGGGYTESYSSTVSYSTSVPVGQCGYLQSYSGATKFDGTYTDCDDGVDKAGTALVVRENDLQYGLTLVSC